jgi:phosphoribosyl-ATP pyrophosphohydrolase
MSSENAIERLYQSVTAVKDGTVPSPRTSKLLTSGRSNMAKKLAEEAVEVVIDSLVGNRDAVIRESADLIYNLTVLWTEAGITPQEVWAEMERRERLLGIAEKLPKTDIAPIVMQDADPQPPAIDPVSGFSHSGAPSAI